jgi:hypothetical protein
MSKHAKNLQAMLVVLPKDICHVHRDVIHDAAVELKTLAADAARYQWMRSRDLNAIDKGGIFAGQMPQNLVINGEDLDREIDAAISKESVSI